MTNKVKTLEEAQALLAEYEALPDIDARIDWTGYARLPDYRYTCVCGYSKPFPMHIDDLKQTIEKGWEWKLEHHKERCFGHEADDEDNKEDEEDE